MRFGGPVFSKYSNPEEWVSVLKKLSCYVYCGERTTLISAQRYITEVRLAGIFVT